MATLGLGILGIFVPFVWLIGAMLPAKAGSANVHQIGTPAAHA